MSPTTLLITRREIAALLNIEECTTAVERMFRLYGQGKTPRPGVLGVHARDGGFHIKAGVLELDRQYFHAHRKRGKEIRLPFPCRAAQAIAATLGC